MQQRQLGQLSVSAVGLGCMGFTAVYGGHEEKASIATLHRAVELGVTLFDTAEVYGPYDNEQIVGRALRPFRDTVTIATKFGFAIGEEGIGFQRVTGVNGSPAQARSVAEASLKRLGVDVIDLYYLHRPDPATPIEETVAAMADLVREGKVREIGLSEVSAGQLRRAHAIHPIAALQSEYSLWTRDVERDILPACRELGISFVPYSPLGRGFLSGKIRGAEDFGENDFRAAQPRFTGDNLAANLALVDRLQAMGEARGVSAAQLALAWVLAQGEDVIPIPGARRIEHLEANIAAADLVLAPDDLAAIGAVMADVQGPRYGEREMSIVGRD
ncbi:aldo/keto reductase [Novosphingobium rosa]|uniref:aldo/keto reductase n=1 Tax=Novosphingobium rosa TaxID=76978 RepID=UPI000833DEEF|nr:aldo/keto reductase [Novosphingobium rosa]